MAADSSPISGVGSWINDITPGDGLLGPNTAQFMDKYTPSGNVARGLVGAGTLGYEMLDQRQSPQMGNIASIANQLGATGSQYLTGQLPAGQQSMIEQASKANIQNVKNHYAQMGLSGSTMEAQAVSNEYSKVMQMQGAESVRLVSEGVQMLGIDAQLVGQMWQANQEQNRALGEAIKGFVGSIAGSGTDRQDQQMLASLRRVTQGAA